jgi:hypothetical protein
MMSELLCACSSCSATALTANIWKNNPNVSESGLELLVLTSCGGAAAAIYSTHACCTYQ